MYFNLPSIASYVKLDNKYIPLVFAVLLVIYAVFIIPRLPKSIVQLFGNYFFIAFVLILTVLIARFDSTLGILAAIGVILSIHAHYKQKISSEMMAVIGEGNMPPEYIYSECSDKDNQPNSEITESDIAGIMNEIPDDEIQSLCKHHRNTAELLDRKEEMKFAKHQFVNPKKKVPCKDMKTVIGTAETDSLAPIL